ncbi:GIN domain-containing protein [Riemerella anatipestifer]|uniref:GIN domain-containing protein n=1 Tax=Riemerella anatipestifer TaxID=34085 RepID=UPI0030BC2B8A
MKNLKNWTLLFLTLFVVSVYSQKVNLTNAPTKTQTFDVASFNQLKVQSNIGVKLVKSNQEKVEVTSNALDYLTVVSSNGVLTLKYKPNTSLKNAKTKAIVYTKNINKMELSGASSVESQDTFSTSDIRLSGASNVSGNFNAKNINLSCSGASDFKGNLNADNTAIKISGASNTSGTITVKSAKIEVSGASNINSKINAANVTTLEVSGASEVVLKGISNKIIARASSASKIDLSDLSYSSIEKESHSMSKIISK